MYSLLVIPGLNLVPPFLFFLALHITYTTGALFRRRRRPSPDLESGTQGSIPPSRCSSHAELAPPPSKNQTAFLIVGLICLAIINVILLVDIELTLRRNKGDQSPEEDQCGFGQILAWLLPLVPRRDFATSIMDIGEKVAREKEAKEKIQRSFEKHLREAINDNTLVGHDFQGLIEQGADPKAELEADMECRTLLELAASVGKKDLLEFLIKKGIEDGEGRAFHIAARHNRFESACLLGKDRKKSERAGTTKRAIHQVLESRRHPDPDVRQVALESLSGLGAQGVEPKKRYNPAPGRLRKNGQLRQQMG
ncbi:hypothetical protein FB451DRAFT_1555661 [Mycena latifolia]|nr:hypothetical protein FB451DRAFT_1555661 [Mycena latifolia]